ncbi:hypothetical protein EVA_21517, partial [gut metagenome]
GYYRKMYNIGYELLIHIDDRHPFFPSLSTGIGCAAFGIAIKVGYHTAGMGQYIVVSLEIASVEVVVTEMYDLVCLG